MFIVGIDVAKRSHEVCMITSDGQTVQRPFSIRNNCTGYNLMLEKIRKHTNIKSQIVFAMESTAHYWLALFTRLRKDGYDITFSQKLKCSAVLLKIAIVSFLSFRRIRRCIVLPSARPCACGYFPRRSPVSLPYIKHSKKWMVFYRLSGQKRVMTYQTSKRRYD